MSLTSVLNPPGSNLARTTQAVNVLDLTFQERQAVRSVAECLADAPTEDPQEFLTEAAALAGELPERLRRAAVHLRRRYQGGDAFLVRGLSTPERFAPVALSATSAHTVRIEESTLLLIAMLAGEPLGYAGNAQAASVLRRLAPILSSAVPGTAAHELRTENGLYPTFPQQLALRTGSTSGRVELVLGRLEEALPRLTARALDWLQRPLYWLSLPESAAIRYTKALPILTQAAQSFHLGLDVSSLDAMHEEALSAARELDAALRETAYHFVLAPGDVALLNNTTTVHALRPCEGSGANGTVERLCMNAN